ncbi:MAG: thioredoxin-disulfide reductase [Flavobacteriaceae bacterium]|nr:thioredoxin-disulfide reductase [Flavobacteriaceae bacterium]MCY4267336.1 thioredoxin-disulfide reductase [Flavobacteriaceae bacterium]
MYKTIIIGSGPAGYTAAIYAARADLEPILYAGLEPGGQLTTTTDVDNFPGYPKGILGPQMMDELKEQAQRFGTIVKSDYVSKVEFVNQVGGTHLVYDGSDNQIKTQTVIISTGATAKYLNLPSEQRLIGAGVSACAVCDGFFYRNKEVAIVGGGDSACQEASYLANICKKVTMLVRKGQMRASKAMIHRVHSLENIEIKYHHEVSQVLGQNVVEGLEIVHNQSNEKSQLAIEGLFIAIGHTPNTKLFEGQLIMDQTGYIITNGKTTKTNLPGVFASGDVQDHLYRQAVTAAGTGCMAALDAERYLQELPNH